MSKITKFISIFILTIFLIACGDPKLDTSSDEAMKKSAHEIMSKLSPEDKDKFQKTVAGIYIMVGFSSMGKNQSPDTIKEKVNEMIDGKTAKEIFSLADEFKKSRN